MLQTLFQSHAHLAGINGNTAFLKVKSEPILKIMMSKTSDVEAVFSLVMGKQLTVKFVLEHT
jgi:hypothetical protein